MLENSSSKCSNVMVCNSLNTGRNLLTNCFVIWDMLQKFWQLVWFRYHVGNHCIDHILRLSAMDT